MRNLCNVFLAAAVLMLAAVFSGGCVSNAFYRPDQRVYRTPANHGLRYEEVWFTSQDNTRLHGWFIPATTAEPALGTVIHFHGNAQNMTAHLPGVAWLPAEGFNLFVFDYRGYGRSEGCPSRAGVFEDCAAAVEYIRARKDLDPQKLIIFGQSLGGANALALMGERKCPGVRAVVADCAFSSYRGIMRERAALIPVVGWFRWPLSYLLLTDAHSPDSAIGRIAPTPVLLVHGTADQVVYFHHMQKLYAKAGEPKAAWTVQGGGHIDAFRTPGSPARAKLVEWFKAALAAPPAK